MIVSIGGIKGGVGKSTIATNLAVMAARNGGDVLLIDTDPQESARDFVSARIERLGDAGLSCVSVTGPTVRQEALRARDKYTHIFIDCAARESDAQRAAWMVSDVVVIPTAPSVYDVWTIGKTAAFFEADFAYGAHHIGVALVNQAEPRGQDNDAAADCLRDGPWEVAGHVVRRKVYRNAAALGLGVVEMKPEDKKATSEITSLFSTVEDAAKRAINEKGVAA